MPFFNLTRVWISVQFGEFNALKPDFFFFFFLRLFARNKSLYPNQHFLNHGSICISFERMTLKWVFDAGCGTDVSSWCLTDVGKIIFIAAFAKIAGNILFGMYIFITAMWHSAVTFLHFSPHRYHFLSLVLMNGKQMKPCNKTPRVFFFFLFLACLTRLNELFYLVLSCFSVVCLVLAGSLCCVFLWSSTLEMRVLSLLGLVLLQF